MIARKATIRNEYGIHCRPSAIIVQELKDYPGTIRVRDASGQEADAKHLLELISLGLRCGAEIEIEVDGPDEEAMAEKAAELFERHFEFVPRDKA